MCLTCIQHILNWTSYISRARQLQVVTIPDSAGGDKCGPPALTGTGACIEKGSEDTHQGAGWENPRVLFATHFSFPSLPFMTDMGPFAGEASPSRNFSPLSQPLALSRCSPVPQGPPTSELTQPRRPPYGCCPPCHSTSYSRLPFCCNRYFLGFHSNASKGRGKGPADWGPILIGVGHAPFTLPSSACAPPPRWIPQDDWPSLGLRAASPSSDHPLGRGRRWAPCTLIG